MYEVHVFLYLRVLVCDTEENGFRSKEFNAFVSAQTFDVVST